MPIGVLSSYRLIENIKYKLINKRVKCEEPCDGWETVKHGSERREGEITSTYSTISKL